jgi:hypothetical protein
VYAFELLLLPTPLLSELYSSIGQHVKVYTIKKRIIIAKKQQRNTSTRSCIALVYAHRDQNETHVQMLRPLCFMCVSVAWYSFDAMILCMIIMHGRLVVAHLLFSFCSCNHAQQTSIRIGRSNSAKAVCVTKHADEQ